MTLLRGTGCPDGCAKQSSCNNARYPMEAGYVELESQAPKRLKGLKIVTTLPLTWKAFDELRQLNPSGDIDPAPCDFKPHGLHLCADFRPIASRQGYSRAVAIQLQL